MKEYRDSYYDCDSNALLVGRRKNLCIMNKSATVGDLNCLSGVHRLSSDR